MKENLIDVPWAKLFTGNRSAKYGMHLTYISPEVVNGQYVINLDKTEVENETEKWRKSLIVNIIGDVPCYNQMHMYVSQTWNTVTEPELFLH